VQKGVLPNLEAFISREAWKRPCPNFRAEFRLEAKSIFLPVFWSQKNVDFLKSGNRPRILIQS
jgi:hypothetical protein